MLHKDTTEFFAYGPKELKERVRRLGKIDYHKFSESKICIAGIRAVIDRFEREAANHRKKAQK